MDPDECSRKHHARYATPSPAIETARPRPTPISLRVWTAPARPIKPGVAAKTLHTPSRSIRISAVGDPLRWRDAGHRDRVPRCGSARHARNAGLPQSEDADVERSVANVNTRSSPSRRDPVSTRAVSRPAPTSTPLGKILHGLHPEEANYERFIREQVEGELTEEGESRDETVGHQIY